MKFSRLALAITYAPLAALAASHNPHIDDQLKLRELVVTASRIVENKDDVSTDLTVFTRADIERYQANSVSDLLRRTPGIQVAHNGGRGSTFGVYIRGTKTAQSLVLIDGQRVNDTNLGGGPLNTLSLDQIERIEILRGPRSAVYGSDAIGGVIHIFTRRSATTGITPRIRVAYGSHNTWEQSVGLSGGDRETRFNISMNHEESKGISRSTLKQGRDRDKDGFKNDSVTLNVSHKLTDKTEIGFSLLHAEGDYDYDAFGWGNYPYDEYNNDFYSGFISSQLTDSWTSRLDIGYAETQLENFDRDMVTNSYNESERESATWLNTLKLNNHHRLQAGLDWYRDSIKNSGNYTEDSRYNSAAFVQHMYKNDVLSTEVGVRHDDNEQFGSHNSWNGAVTVPLNQQHDVTLSYSEGFRAPLMSDLYYPVSCYPGWGCSGGNPHLDAETSKTYEASWQARFSGGVVLETSIYRTQLKDAIEGWSPRNVAEARMDGLEVTLNANVLGWENQFTATYVKAEDRLTEKDLVNRARQKISWDIDRQFGDIGLGASWVVVGKAYSDASNSTVIPGYGLVGLRASWQATPELAFGFKIENVLDKDYYTTTNSGIPYQEYGRTAQLSFTWMPQ